ncbi:uncharacterized protein LOC109853962 [Pseudomyrmex gracilis]|uniref:uncharacterized protein LOC109853962 n=1 Tax=Pseudomyrmex gracilis TaxID=219809 RepID=UPI000995BD60|nr:uncharacterized protein LOC109853962 [Pseudomyrmex gracilis]
MEEVETDMNESQEELDQENEDEEIEYVVERLDDDILENQEVNEDKSIEMVKDEEIYVQKEEVDDLCAQLQSDEDDPKLIVKKVKLPEEKCRDPLAQAMAHVHSEYLDEEGEEMDNLEMEVEMVVESTDPMISDREETLTETYEEANSIQEANKRSLEKSQEDININLVPAGSSVILDSGTEPISFEAVTSKIDNNNSNKTVTLMCGSKTFTLSGGSFQPGTQYVLTKLQNKPTINDSKTRTIKVTETDKTKLSVALGSTSNINQTLFTPSTGESPVPGTSQISVVCETKTPNRKISFGKQTLKREYKKMNLTTHVIDSTKGLPVAGLQVCVYKLMDGKWTFLNESTTNIEGRCNDLVDKVSCPAGRYKIHYDVDKYFSVRKIDTLFPFIEIIIDAKNPNTHYHLPLLLSPFGYTTYRGS